MSMKGIVFQHAKIGRFFQPMPRVGNPYNGDPFMQRLLQRLLPQQVFTEVDGELRKLGQRVEEEIEALGVECEMNEPQLRQFDPWGNRVDELVTSGAWKRMKEITAEEGIVATGYSGKYNEFDRIFQFAKCLIFHPSSGLYSCPIAMTDGAAKTFRELKSPKFDWVYKRLTSKSPQEFWTSGQWMTERKGGSDVANGTETVAVKGPNDTYKLYGYKWFSSATDADVVLTLARIADKEGSTQEGTKGVSMFLLKTRRDDGSLNNIQIMKLKNKLGTRSLPTAELLLDGTDAELVSEEGRGIPAITHMLTVTRIHNTVGSVSAMRRVALLARDYSEKRSAFGQLISKYPLHVDTLAQMELEARAGTILLFEVLRLLGIVENGKASAEEEYLLRLLTPVAKLYTAKKCMGVASEGLECFGGQGYIEETGLPAILRNAQVTPIWEGTTNVLSLDTLRAIAKSKGEALQAFYKNVTGRLSADAVAECAELEPAAKRVEQEMLDLITTLPELTPHDAMSRARVISFAVAEIEIGMLLVEQAASQVGTQTDMVAALRWASQMKKFSDALSDNERFNTANSHEMVFEGYKAKL